MKAQRGNIGSRGCCEGRIGKKSLRCCGDAAARNAVSARLLEIWRRDGRRGHHASSGGGAREFVAPGAARHECV
jgi:hypothetical protein